MAGPVTALQRRRWFHAGLRRRRRRLRRRHTGVPVPRETSATGL